MIYSFKEYSITSKFLWSYKEVEEISLFISGNEEQIDTTKDQN